VDRRWISVAPALALVVVIAVIDVALGSGVSIVPLLVIGPLLAATMTGPRRASLVGVLAVALAVALAIGNDAFPDRRFFVGVGTVAIGAVLGPVIAATRQRERAARRMAERDRARATLLARAGRLFETGDDPLMRLDDLAALAVPEMAGLCVIDLIGPDGLLRAAGTASSATGWAEQLTSSRTAHPIPPTGKHPAAVVARSSMPLLLRGITDRELVDWATSDEHLALMRALGYRSLVSVPLSARGTTVGTLSMVRFGDTDSFGPADLETAGDLARRAGLAIDHARLGRELGETEAELRTVLGALAEAVTVQGPDGGIVYANAAAARLLGFDSVAEMLDTPAGTMRDAWDVHDEAGHEVASEALPGRRALAGEAAPELLLQITHRETGERRWRLIKASPILDTSGRPRLAVNVIEDVTDLRRREFTQAFLARASKLLTASLDATETLENLAWSAVPELADWCAVDMPDDRGVLRRVATADRRPDRAQRDELVVGERRGERALRVGPPQVLRTGVSEFYPEVDEALLRQAARDDAQLARLREVGARSVLVVPMVGTAGVIGTITLGTIESRRRLTADDLALAEELGRRAGIAVEHSRIHGERSIIASTLQAALLPPRLPIVPGLTIAARFRAAGGGDTVGGDFYDLFALADDPTTWMVVMGDVTGKGPAAAAITSVARYAIRTAALYEHDPSRLLARLNHVLVHDDHGRRLCTAVCARVETGRPGGTAVTVACAGHPPPLLAGRDGGVRAFGEAGTLLGAFDDGHWTDTTMQLGEGDSLVLYTDGVTDTRGRTGRFGPDRLEQVVAGVAGRAADEVAEALDDALLRFQEGAQRDDVAVLVLQADGGGSGVASVTASGAGGVTDPAEDAGSSPAAA
jgi:PAS domain S-box-containing protein